MTESDLRFRTYTGEADLALLLDLNLSSRKADADPTPVSVESIAEVLASMEGLTPAQGVVIAYLAGEPVGYSRLGWYTSRPENRLYFQISFLRQEYRQSGLWPALVAENERRLLVLDDGNPPVKERFFQAWAAEYQHDWTAALQSSGYQAARRFNNMLFQLSEDIPSLPLPVGLEAHPALPEQMRMVWEAQKEFNAGLFENVDLDWLEERYPAWLVNPENRPDFWQLAWDGSQLAGMMLARPGAAEKRPRRGYTEHIYVRPGWRGRGLASALISRSLQALKAAGMDEAELGVDSQNESAAYRLYENLGYKTFSVDTWFRKAITNRGSRAAGLPGCRAELSQFNPAFTSK